MSLTHNTINTLVLVENASQAETVADQLRETGHAISQSWVSTTPDFSAALQREVFDMGILYLRDSEADVPASILRYPDTPFVAIMERYRNRIAEELLGYGLTEVVGLSHPVRLNRVLSRLLTDGQLRRKNRALEERNQSHESMFHTLLQRTTEPVAYVHQGMHSFGNPAYHALTGFRTPDELAQTPLLDIIAGDDHDIIAMRLKELEEGQSTAETLSTRLINQQGNELPVTLQFTRSWYDEESVLQMIVSEAAEADPIAQLDAFESDETIQIDPIEILSNLNLAAGGNGYHPQTPSPSMPNPSANDRFENPQMDIDELLMMDTIAILPEDLPATASSSNSLADQSDSSDVGVLEKQAGLVAGIKPKLHVEAITSLRSDGAERIHIALTEDPRGIRGLEDDIDLAELDRWVLTETIEKAANSPSSAYFVQVHTSDRTLISLLESFDKTLKSRDVSRRAVTLIVDPVDGFDGAAQWRPMIQQAHMSGFGICLRHPEPAGSLISSFEALANTGIDYVMFNQSAIGQPDSNDVRDPATVLKHCQQRSIRSIASIDDPEKISNAWSLGFDCFVIQPLSV